MDQKHSMLYPSLSGRRSEASSTSQNNGSSTAESPPSYDVAMAIGGTSAEVETTSPSPSATIGFQKPHQYPIPASSQAGITAALENYSANVNALNTVTHPIAVEQPGEENLKLGPHPSKITCPECGERRRTRMHFTSNRRTHIFAVVLCLVGWCCCACTVPYCMRSCKTGHHYCAKCNRFLGTYNRNEF